MQFYLCCFKILVSCIFYAVMPQYDRKDLMFQICLWTNVAKPLITTKNAVL